MRRQPFVREPLQALLVQYLTTSLDDRRQQLLLAAEVVVHQRQIDSRGAGDVAYRSSVEAAPGKELLRGVHQLFLGGALGPGHAKP